MEIYKFDCGCEFPILDSKIKEDGLPSLELDYDKISLQCPKAWTIFAEGLTKGVFQLEKELGQDWSRRVQPISILEVSDLISVIRPGTLKYILDNKCMTQHYVDRKHLHEECESLDPSIDHIMEETYQVMIYQEQAMQIAQVIAGFDLKQADNLRKAIGKKLADLMTKVKKEFLEGAKKVGIVSEEKAKQIFDNIEKSARYSFNKCLSHNTLVQKENGEFVTLEEVSIGDKINSPDGFIEIVNKYENGKKELYEICLESSKKIQCTLDHKFLTNDGIKPLFQLYWNQDKIATDNDTYEKITSMYCIGSHKSIDIEIDSSNHIFYGNGIATSNSHAASYAKTGYYCAFVKAHFPLQFYTSWLSNARNKPDFTEEAAELINDAISFNISILTPSILSKNEDFKIENKKIRYGLGAIKGVGDKAVHKLINELEALATKRKKDIKDCSWLEILLLLSPNVNKTTFSALICAGALSHLGIYRQRMLFEYNNLLDLTGKNELPWLQDNIDSFSELSTGIKALLNTDNVKKIRKEKVLSITKILDKPTSELKDSEGWVADTETKLFGIALSCSKLDTCDVSMRDTTCAALKYKEAKSFTLAVYISKVADYIPKSGKIAGKRMLYLTLNDHTGSIKAVAFPDCIKEYDYLLFKGNTVAVSGKKSDKGGLTLSKVIQI